MLYPSVCCGKTECCTLAVYLHHAKINDYTQRCFWYFVYPHSYNWVGQNIRNNSQTAWLNIENNITAGVIYSILYWIHFNKVYLINWQLSVNVHCVSSQLKIQTFRMQVIVDGLTFTKICDYIWPTQLKPCRNHIQLHMKLYMNFCISRAFISCFLPAFVLPDLISASSDRCGEASVHLLSPWCRPGSCGCFLCWVSCLLFVL